MRKKLLDTGLWSHFGLEQKGGEWEGGAVRWGETWEVKILLGGMS